MLYVAGTVKFRYLQGYMGTKLEWQVLLREQHLDTFKDIWGLTFENKSTTIKTDLDTFKDIWGPDKWPDLAESTKI